MKRFMLVMATVAVLLMCASSGAAWEVKIKNSCNKDVTIDVKGEHLFWKQVDCTVTVKSGATGTCQLPGAICPFEILGTYWANRSLYDLNKIHCMTATTDICCCWNVNAEVVQYSQDSCRLELR
jgi:hypothetical protein